MTVWELKQLLATYPPDAKVVIDVDADQCHSDRNVLEVEGVSWDNTTLDGTVWVFLDAGKDA